MVEPADRPRFKSINTDCHGSIPPQEGWYVNLTPINSIHLREHHL
ncbi:hypothetical protein [Streptomyces sp. 3214.6]|nr:hypothetical protein [Streptomyces sp. 3214.6]